MADKKLAKKLAKMSEEDRVEFLEQQKLENQDMQKKKEEMLTRFLKVSIIIKLSTPISRNSSDY